MKNLETATSKNKAKEELLDKIMTNLTQACNFDPKNAQAYTYRGRGFLFKSEYKRALFDFSAAIHALNNYKGQAYDQKPTRDFFLAFPFDSMDDAKPTPNPAGSLSINYNFAGMCNHALGQFEEALAHYNIADSWIRRVKSSTNLDENLRSDILFNRGQTYTSLGGIDNLNKAIVDFKAASDLQKDKSNTERHKTLFNLGIVYRRIGDKKQSIEKLIEATTLNVSKAATSNNLGLSHFDNEEFDLAMNCFQIAAGAEAILVETPDKGSEEDLAFYYNNMGLC